MEVANDCGNSEKIYPSFDINSYLDFLVGLNSPEQKILNSVVVNATLGYLFFFFPQNEDRNTGHGVFFIW